MKNKDLIKKLQKLNPDSTICLGEKEKKQNEHVSEVIVLFN